MKQIGKVYGLSKERAVLDLAVALHKAGYYFHPFLGGKPWHNEEDTMSPEPVQQDNNACQEYKVLKTGQEGEGRLDCSKREITTINTPALDDFLSNF